MVIAVLSDIHANLQALDAVIADARAQGAQQFIVAGDHVIDGPSLSEVLERVAALTPYTIRGNREEILLEHRAGDGPNWAQWHQAASMQWSYERMGSREWSYLDDMPAQLSLELEGCSLRVVHGAPWHVRGKLERQEDIERAVGETSEGILIHGHNHVPRILISGGKLLLNPGSVGVHFDTADDTAKYALLYIENGRTKAALRSVAYDSDALWREIRTSGLLDAAPWWTMLTFMGNRDGCNYCPLFLADAEAERRRRGLPEEGFLPNDVWEDVWERWVSRLPQLRF